MHGIIIPENIQNWIKFSNPPYFRAFIKFSFSGKKSTRFDRTNPYGVRFSAVREKSVQDFLYES